MSGRASNADLSQYGQIVPRDLSWEPGERENIHFDLLPGFKKHGLKPPPPKKVKKITDPRKIDKYKFFYEKQSYMIVKPCSKHKAKKKRRV